MLFKTRLYLRNDANFDLCYEIYSNLMQFTLYNPRNFIIIWCKNRTLTQFLQFHYYLMTQQQLSISKYLRNDITLSYECSKWSIEWRGSHVNGWRVGKNFFFNSKTQLLKVEFDVNPYNRKCDVCIDKAHV